MYVNLINLFLSVYQRYYNVLLVYCSYIQFSIRVWLWDTHLIVLWPDIH